MSRRKIALIGHSGAGKSAALRELGVDPKTADMDCALGVEKSPSLSDVMAWLGAGSACERIVVVIAVAALHNIDYLLTWNCKHLANAQIMRRIELVCEQEGRRMPLICTPEELMGD